MRLRHSDRPETVYAHLTRVARPLKVGDSVTPDDVIGHVGLTGRSTVPHLHFELRRAGQPVDPLGVKLARKTKGTVPKTRDASP